MKTSITNSHDPRAQVAKPKRAHLGALTRLRQRQQDDLDNMQKKAIQAQQIGVRELIEGQQQPLAVTIQF